MSKPEPGLDVAAGNRSLATLLLRTGRFEQESDLWTSTAEIYVDGLVEGSFFDTDLASGPWTVVAQDNVARHSLRVSATRPECRRERCAAIRYGHQQGFPLNPEDYERNIGESISVSTCSALSAAPHSEQNLLVLELSP